MLTNDLIARKGTDLDRWRDEGNLALQWDGRAEIAGRLLGADVRRVLDVGAGAMALKAFLPAACAYVPADVAKRSEDCLVTDLNRREFPEGRFDAVTFLGVLEYIHDPAWSLRMAARASPALVVSYCADTSGDIAYRRGLGWVNDFTKEDFEALLSATGWDVQSCVVYKQSAANTQFVWRCARRTRRRAGDLPEAPMVVLSPALVDPRTAKKVNAGDGFILDSAVKLIGARPTALLSTRIPLTDEDIERINASRLLLVAGANTLKSHFEFLAGVTPQMLERIRVPVALMGIGHYGVAEATAQPLDAASEAVVREILSRFPYISVRCDASAAYLRQSTPELAQNVLMTSCPVAHSVDDVHRGFEAKSVYDQLVCTVTDRVSTEQQLPLLQAAAKLFPARHKVLALHQDYGNQPLWQAAERLGYEVFRSESYEDFLDLYAAADMHFGNRLHGHLKCLSLGVRSYLTPFDLRQQFFAESLDFPLITRAPDEALTSYDFRRAEARIAAARPAMDAFVGAVRAAIGLG